MRFLVLPLLVVALSTPLWAQVGLTELNHRTSLQFLSYKDSQLSVQLSYLNITYYSKADIEKILNDPFNPDPSADVSTNEIKIRSGLLADADVYFTFDAAQVSEDGSSPSCSPAKTDKDGIARCTPKFVKTQNGFEKLEDRKSCGTFQAEFRGAMKGSDEFRPSVGSMVWCPAKSPALSAFGPALFSALGSGANLAFCFPALLVAGLLIATMYYSGRDPFSLFDLTSPRLPRMRPSRVSTGATMMGVRSAVARYNEAKRMARRNSEKMLAELVGRGGGKRKERAEARREVRKLFKDVDASLGQQDYSETKFGDYRRRLADIYMKYGLSKFGEDQRKLYSKYIESSGQLLNLYTSSDVASRTMSEARAPPSSGWLYKKAGAWQTKISTTLDRAESKIMSAPGFSKFIRFVPVAGVVALPKKVIDTIAQRRSAKRWTKYTRRMATGQAIYMTLGSKMEGGERVARPWFQKFGQFLEKTPIAAYNKWSFQDFQERHNLYRKMVGALDNPAEKYRVLSQDMLNHALLILAPEILDFEKQPKEQTQRIKEVLAGAGRYKTLEEQLKALLAARGLKADVSKIGEIERQMAEYGIVRENGRYACKPATKEFMEKALAQMENESQVSSDNKFIYKGLLSQFKEAMVTLKSEIGSKDAVSFGLDPAGYFVARQFKEITRILYKSGATKDLKELADVSNMNEFETRYSKSGGKKERNALGALSEAIMGADKETRERLCKQLHVPISDMDEPHKYKKLLRAMELELEKVVSNRKTAIERLSSLDEADLKRLAKILGADPREKAKILELLSAIDSTGMKRQVKGILNMNEEEISESSVTQFLFVKVLEKTQNELEKWGAKMLRAGDMLSRNPELTDKSLQELRTKFIEAVNWAQQVEYAAMRRVNVFSHYHGESAQHIETLLFMTRAYNRAAEFAMAKAFKGTGMGPVAGSLLGSLDSIMDHTMHSYRMQKALYFNLINDGSKLYDDKFAKQLNIPKEAPAKFDADAYLALKNRGFLFRDAKYAPYVASSANVGVMPLLEYDENVLKAQNRKNGVIIGKGDVPEYGPLLSRVNISDFSSEVKGIMALYESQGGKLLRVDPRRIPEVETLYDAAKVEMHRRSDLMKLLAGINAGGEFDAKNRLMHFVHNSDYIDQLKTFRKTHPEFATGSKFNNFIAKGLDLASKQGYYKAVSKAGEFTYGVFYENLHQLRDWYAAQARARHALYTVTQSAEKWATIAGRLNAEGYRAGNNGLILKDELDPEKKEIMEKLVKKLEEFDKSAAWMKKNLRLLEASGDFSKGEKGFGAAEWQSKMYEAKLEKEALKKMKDARQLDPQTYRSLASEIDGQYKAAKEHYKDARKESSAFTRTAIEVAGSHPDYVYYGSRRNIFTMSGLIPEFKYHQGLAIGMGFTVESSAMRDSPINRGGQRGGESMIKMNMDTGQGIYENPRWWAVSAYEQQTSPFLVLPHFIHRQLLPNAAIFYRSQMGLSSSLQRTELDSDWGRAKTKLHTLFGLERGSSDIFGSTAQEILDFTGASTLLYALRKGGKVRLDKNDKGELTIKAARSWFVKPLERFGVESTHVLSDTQIFVQNRMQDRVLESREWKDDHLRKNVQEWMVEYKLLQYETDDAEKKKHDERLKELEKDLTPFANKFADMLSDPFAYRFSDERPRVNRKSAGGGNYFMKDGSRDRFMNLFIVDHINTWRPIIPGMTETGPFTSTFLSPQVTAYFDEMASFRPGAARLAMMKDFKYYGYDEETGGIKELNKFDTHHEAYRDVYKFDVPALMHVIKAQSYIKQYEGITPILSSVMSIPYWVDRGVLSRVYLDKTSRPLQEGQKQFVNQELASITGLPAGSAQSALWKNSMLRYYDWDEIRYGQNVKPPPSGAQMQPPQQPDQPPQGEAAEPEPNAKMAGLVAEEGQDMAEGYQRSKVQSQEELDFLRYMITGNKRGPITWFRNLWREHSLQNQFEREQHERNLYVIRRQIYLQNL